MTMLWPFICIVAPFIVAFVLSYGREPFSKLVCLLLCLALNPVIGGVIYYLLCKKKVL